MQEAAETTTWVFFNIKRKPLAIKTGLVILGYICRNLLWYMLSKIFIFYHMACFFQLANCASSTKTHIPTFLSKAYGKHKWTLLNLIVWFCQFKWMAFIRKCLNSFSVVFSFFNLTDTNVINLWTNFESICHKRVRPI